MAKTASKNISKSKHQSILIGWREWVSFPDNGNFSIKAKIDTGARTSAVHATHIRELVKNDKKWVKFRLYQSGKYLFVEIPIIEYRKITNSFGVSEQRPVINIKIKLGKNSWKTEVTLARRSGMTYPMLIGRNSLKINYLVHPHQSYLIGAPNNEQK